MVVTNKKILDAQPIDEKMIRRKPVSNPVGHVVLNRMKAVNISDMFDAGEVRSEGTDCSIVIAVCMDDLDVSFPDDVPQPEDKMCQASR